VTPLTYLFVPGNRPERFAKAWASHADRVILDLEDAVSPQDKVSARASIGSWLTSAEPASRAWVLVRINNALSPWHTDDLAWLQSQPMSEVMLSKCETPEQVALVLTMASRLADLPAPVAGVTPDLDPSVVASDAERALALGMGAKLCIRRQHIDMAHQAFVPNPATVAGRIACSIPGVTSNTRALFRSMPAWSTSRFISGLGASWPSPPFLFNPTTSRGFHGCHHHRFTHLRRHFQRRSHAPSLVGREPHSQIPGH
jgi:citrate lyase beta subunit